MIRHTTDETTARRIEQSLVAVKGAGDLATGVIHRLHRAGFPVAATELPEPTVVRRTVSFAEAVLLGEMTVEGVTAQRVTSLEEITGQLANGRVPVIVDPEGHVLRQLRPPVLVEATLSKRNTGITIDDAPIVIALGPGYEAGRDAHAVVETNRGHNLGRVYYEGSAEPNTGVPGAIAGYTIERLLKAPAAGKIYGVRQIGDMVQADEVVAQIHEVDCPGEPCSCQSVPVIAAIPGILRGLLRDSLTVSKGMKVGDIDPRAAREHCFTISDKSRAIGGGVLEAILHLMQQLPQ
ncbi:MAG TPA: selenium-dependent molybdenum cofactor biosynthesis protein YqeB [Ktedonobacteraceae bacterium]|nr:selenium-dependent molybdenum cofactor biosynthesis protein YqeB [Ktedonobacteraceae bacterium]